MFASVGRFASSPNAPIATTRVGMSRKTPTKTENGSTPTRLRLNHPPAQPGRLRVARTGRRPAPLGGSAGAWLGSTRTRSVIRSSGNRLGAAGGKIVLGLLGLCIGKEHGGAGRLRQGRARRLVARSGL